jgi:alkylated DNA nucleotide flippase Atl1
MHALPANSDVPWHRVVNAAGKVSLRLDASATTSCRAAAAGERACAS